MSSKLPPTYAITGIQTGKGPQPGQVPLRQEIDAWYAQRGTDANVKKQIDLFLLGLQTFQQRDPTNKLSYFQVTGIHGMPLVPWDEVIGVDINPAIPSQGYCNHNSTLFGTWHRPYLALFEQLIYECMLEVVAQYPASAQAAYKQLADTWRLPYWDWALESDIPEILKLPQISVDGPKGTTTINNPLYKFTLVDRKGNPQAMGPYGIKPISFGSDYYGPFDICTATSRYPPDYSDDPSVQEAWVEGVENNDDVVAAIKADADFPSSTPPPLKEWVYRIFSMTDWDTFSTTLERSIRGSNNMSLEGVHNALHDYCGGSGHMSQVPVAAFDPIFWLHHCNVDRLLAIWQAVNPNGWFSDRNQQIPDPGCYYVPRRSIPTPQTKLHPFHKDTNRTLYTSDDIRDWKVLGYSYPELQPWKFTDAARYRADVRQSINRLYSSTRRLFLGQPQFGIQPQSVPDQPQVQAQAGIHAQAVAPHQPPVTHHDYLVSVLYSRHELEGGVPYRVHIFLGPKEETIDKPPQEWRRSKHLVGTIYNFSTKREDLGISPEGCGNCKSQQEQNLLAVGQVPITKRLVKLITEAGGNVDDLDPEAVKVYLRDNLHWGVTTSNGRLVNLENLPSLKIFASSGIAEHYTDNHRLSNYRDYDVHRGITHGRAGGLGHNHPVHL